MSTLKAYGDEVLSIFQLIGDKENDITKSVAWALYKIGFYYDYMAVKYIGMHEESERFLKETVFPTLTKKQIDEFYLKMQNKIQEQYEEVVRNARKRSLEGDVVGVYWEANLDTWRWRPGDNIDRI